MNPLGIKSRTLTIRNHLKEMTVAAQHLDLKRMQAHREIIEDHLHAIDGDIVLLRNLADRITK